jgi:SAM-dependent methyltransferase
MPDYDSYLQANRELWDLKTDIHLKSQFYDIEAFKAGATSLNAIELEELKEVEGKSMLHLQCHFGQDSLSWARLGAQVTGLDFSSEAIAAARQLSDEIGTPARFVCSNVYDAPEVLQEQFDIVFTSYGTIGWLPDIDRWAAVVQACLKPGGTFYFVEFHPVYQQRDAEGKIIYDYFYAPEPDMEWSEHTYTDGPSHPPKQNYWWNHPMSAVLNALIKQGLNIRFVHEFPFSPYKLSETMMQVAPGKWVLQNLKDRIPYTYSILATR